VGKQVRLPGATGYFREEDLGPCGTCGGVAFIVYRRVMRCKKCLPHEKQKHKEEPLGEVDVLRRVFRPAHPKVPTALPRAA
jgi:hypothetical protein